MGSLYGYEIATSLPMRRLQELDGPRGYVRIEVGPDSLLDREGTLTAWSERMGGDGFALARVDPPPGGSAGSLLAWCAATGTYEIDAGRQTIRVACPRLDEGWEHRIGTMAIPLLLAERGELGLHASAVVAGDYAVLFAGPSGRGKSTLALSSARLGHPVLSEDGTVLSPNDPDLRAWPGPRGVRAVDPGPMDEPTERAARGGRRLIELPLGGEARRPVPVGAVCVLAQRGERLHIRPLTPADAVPALMPGLIHSGEPRALARSFALLARLLERVPAYRVSMPSRLDEAPAATALLLSELGSETVAGARSGLTESAPPQGPRHSAGRPSHRAGEPQGRGSGSGIAAGEAASEPPG
jgi:hypothetical protein